MEGTVANTLSPEEKPIIENIISLFQQLLSMQEAGAPTPEPEVMEAMEEPSEETVDVSKAQGETGDSKAEERLAEQTNTTDESLMDLGKAITVLQSMVSKKTVRKAQNTTNPVMGELKKLTKALELVIKNQESQDKLNAQLFEAIGITDDVIAKSLGSNEVKKDAPIQNVDTVGMAKELIKEVFKNIPALNQNEAYRHPFNQKKHEARKNMPGLLNYIHNAKR